MKYKIIKNCAGFTLLEMMLSVAMFTIILGMTLPMLRTFTVRNDLDVTTSTIVQNLRRAQALARVADGDMPWGLHMLSGNSVIYKGATYLTRDASYDDVTAITPSILVEGLQDIVFTKVTGIPQSTGAMTLTSQTNEIRTITINQKGMIDY